MPAKSPSPRFYHLDALRSAAILYGVLVHTATLGVSWPLTLISDVSGYFRMGTFFLVSGFFAAMVLDRFGPGTFLRKRAVALLIPFLCGVLLLNPVTNWLVWTWHNPPLAFRDYLARAWEGTLPPGRGPMVWHLHLWFLVSLSFFALMAPVATAVARRLPQLSTRLGDRLAALPGWACVIAVAALCASASLGLRTFYELTLESVLPGADWGVPWLVRTTLYYWPMFLTGMALFHHRAFAARFQTLSLPALAIGLVCVILLREMVFPQTGLKWEVLQLLSRAFLTVSAVAALMSIFARWFAQPGLLSRGSEAIYSIYILHFLVIYLIAHALHPLGLSQVALFMIVAVLATAALFVAHRYIIRPSAILSLMFNGKPFSASRARREADKTASARQA